MSQEQALKSHGEASRRLCVWRDFSGKGRRTFGGTGETVLDSLAAVLRAELEWTRLPKDTPAGIRPRIAWAAACLSALSAVVVTWGMVTYPMHDSAPGCALGDDLRKLRH
jgi:hypothetical protein